MIIVQIGLNRSLYLTYHLHSSHAVRYTHLNLHRYKILYSQHRYWLISNQIL